MNGALLAALTVGAWILVVLMLAGGYWFLRSRQLLHHAVLVIVGLIGVYLLIRLRELVLMLTLAGVLAFLLAGPVERLSRKMRRGPAIALVYTGVAGLIVLAGVLIIPPIINQIRALVANAPELGEQARQFSERLTLWYGTVPEEVQNVATQILDHVKEASAGFAPRLEHALLEAAAWAVKGILIFIMSIYLVMDQQNLLKQFLRLVPEGMRDEVPELLREAGATLRSYMRGQGIVILFVAVSVTVVLVILRIPYALLIGLFAGLLEVIPYFGALSGAVPAVILGFMKSPGVGIGLIVFFIILNQIEGHVIIPWVMGSQLEMKPLGVLLALIAGEMLGGIPGMIVAVPVVSLARVVIPYVQKYYLTWRMKQGIVAVETPPEAPGEPPGKAGIVVQKAV